MDLTREQVLSLLNSDDPHQRSQAVSASLRLKLRDREAVDQLILRMHDEDLVIRCLTATVLCIMRIQRAVPAIIRGLKDPDYHVRGACATSLGEFIGVRAAPHLTEMINDEDDYVAYLACMTLTEIGLGNASLRDRMESLERDHRVSAMLRAKVRTPARRVPLP